jgi:UDPglucose 6-dehydrogenase
MSKNSLIGFIGQGFIGKNYADDFVARGYRVIRYALEAPYAANRAALADCDVVFIAVPTPTTPAGFNFDTIREVIGLVGPGRTAVVKSTILPGTCAKLQAQYPDRFVFHSPEFLTEKNAAYDAAHPSRNIIGYPIDNEEYRRRAAEILALLPESPLNMICTAAEAELIKYAANGFLFLKLVYANILYDLAAQADGDWEKIKTGLAADSRIGASHLQPVQASSAAGVVGRGAGGHCFIKDFAAFVAYCAESGHDPLGADWLAAAARKNTELLRRSHKDLDLLRDVYGE